MDILKQYFPLCWFKTHPLQLPSSEAFFKQNLIFYFTVEFFTQANMIPVFEAFTEVIADTALTLLFVVIVLSLNRTMHTYIQVASAVLFCENMVAILGVPVIVWLTMTHDWLSYTFLVILLVWDMALISYLMKKVLSIDIFASVIVALLYFATTYGAAYALTLAF
jgi:hypothetical protein